MSVFLQLKGGSDEAARKAEKANNEYIINADELNKVSGQIPSYLCSLWFAHRAECFHPPCR